MMPQNFNNQLLVTVITFTESESSLVMKDNWNNQFLDIKNTQKWIKLHGRPEHDIVYTWHMSRTMGANKAM